MTPPKPRTCRCGHLKSRHTRAWHGNTRGQYAFGMCIEGWKVVHGCVFERADSCSCGEFRRRWLPRFWAVS